MDNEFEVAIWLANRPRILNLALDIKNAKSMSITNEDSSQGLQGSQDLQGLQRNSQVVITQVMLVAYDI